MLWRLLSFLDRLDMRRRGGSYLNTKKVYGSYRCFHRSHRLGLRCLRHWTYASYCGKHNGSCWTDCPKETP